MGIHTVEKIGGTSMTRFGELLDNIFIGSRKADELYNRIFVVSAYGGVTNWLLEDKKTGEPGIYGSFAAGKNEEWQEKLETTRAKLIELNRSFEKLGLDQNKADDFVNERMDGVKSCLLHLMQLRSFGHFKPAAYLPAAREILSSVGEAHSAYNSALILQKFNINAIFVDLSGWKDDHSCSMEENISRQLSGLDFAKCMPIVTGYAKCAEGVMAQFDRGYSEITFSKLAVVTAAREGIIHKEFHLSTGDPKLIGIDKVRTIGHTNFDIADQLSDMGMEAIHPKAAREMQQKNIPIRVKNAFEPEHPGTLISREYVAAEPHVEMICGRKDLIGLEVMDHDMVGASGYDHRLTAALDKYCVNYIAKNTNANTITHFIPERAKNLDACIASMREAFPQSKISTVKVGIVSVIGTNMRIPGFLYRAAKALSDADINVLALDQTMRQVNIQFIVDRADFEKAQQALHKEFVEKD